MDSALRPRDIQARIRAGETPEAVAQAAQTTVDKIMPLRRARCSPSAQHVAERAQRSSRAPQRGQAGRRPHPRRRRRRPPARPQRRPRHRRVGRLAPRGRPLDPDRATSSGDSPHRHRPVHLRRPRQLRRGRQRRRPLAGRRGRRRPRPQPRRPATTCAGPARAGSPSAGDDELPLGDDAIELVTRRPRTPPPSARRAAGRGLPRRRPPRHRDAAVADEPEPSRAELDEAAEQAETDGPRSRRRPSEPGPRSPPRRRGRASVPSWDEIMFGGGKRRVSRVERGRLGRA